tara:strand:+ start:1761 stop:4643 length:2883 start_codon:yes stop_codon:yes gene_type:complete
MKGYIEIYQGNSSGKDLIFEEHNLIVDAAGEHVVDALTINPEPSSLDQQTAYSTAVSGMGIKAMTLGPAKENFRYRTARHLTPTLASGTSVDKFYNLEPRIFNYNFSGTGPNLLIDGASALDNINFIETQSYLKNTKFETNTPGPVDAVNRGECRQLNIADFEDWTTYNPIIESSTPNDDLSLSGSVRWYASSLSLGLDQKSAGYVDLRASSYEHINNGLMKAAAYIEQTFQIPKEENHLVNGDTVSRSDLFSDGYNLSFWCMSEHASANDLRVELRSSTGKTYCFSGNAGDHSRWLDTATDALPLKIPKSASWKFVSIPINFHTFTDDLQGDITVRFLGAGTASAFQSWYIASPSFGRIPGIDNQYTNASSFIYPLESSALACRFQHNQFQFNHPYFSQKVTGLEEGRSYYLAIKYKTINSSQAPKIELLKNNSIADDLEEYDYYNFTTHQWEQSSAGYPVNDAPYTLPLSTSVVTETVGPITGVSANDVYIRWIPNSRNQLDTSEFVGFELSEIKVVDAPHILFQGDYNLDNYTEDTSDNAVFTKSPVIKNTLKNLHYNKTAAVNVQSNPSGTDYYAQFDFKEDASAGRFDITHTMTKEELAPLSGDYIHYAFKYQHTANVNGIAVELKAHTSDDKTYTYDSDASGWRRNTDDLAAWSNPTDNTITVGAGTFFEYFSDGIPSPRFLDDDTRLEFKITPYASKDAAGNYTASADSSLLLSDIRVYRSNSSFDISSFTPESPSPLDTTVQTSSVGPGKLGHFLNYISFSAHGAYADLDFEDIVSHGCYIPSGGITLPADTFGYTNDGSRVNDMSGAAVVGKLNDTSSVNSDGFILESRVARGSQVEGDASAGFVVSAIGTLSSTREVKYILTIKYEDWKFLDYYYGGIGSIGLWTLDRKKTLAKYADETETASIDLYNLDPARNPVFKLFAKKIFLPGGLKLNEASSNDDYITIHWGITF